MICKSCSRELKPNEFVKNGHCRPCRGRPMMYTDVDGMFCVQEAVAKPKEQEARSLRAVQNKRDSDAYTRTRKDRSTILAPRLNLATWPDDRGDEGRNHSGGHAAL